MLRTILLTLTLLLFPTNVVAEESQLPLWAQTIWQGWAKAVDLTDAELDALMADPKRLQEHFGTLAEGSVDMAARIKSGEIATRNPFPAIADYGRASLACAAAKDWLDENQPQVQDLWAFLQEHAIERDGIDDAAGVIVALSSSPMFVSRDDLANYAKPELLGDYLTSDSLPTCLGPKAATLIQAFQTEEGEQTVKNAQAEILGVLAEQVTQGNSDAFRLIIWLAEMNLEE